MDDSVRQDLAAQSDLWVNLVLRVEVSLVRHFLRNQSQNVLRGAGRQVPIEGIDARQKSGGTHTGEQFVIGTGSNDMRAPVPRIFIAIQTDRCGFQAIPIGTVKREREEQEQG